MITISEVDSSENVDGFREIKVIQYGAKTADECSPFGIDSNPVDQLDAIFAETEVSGETVVLGYIQENRKSLPGEVRLYALDIFGEVEVTDIYLRNKGIIEIGGNKDNFVSYKNLNIALMKQNQDLMAELVKIQAAISALGGSYVFKNVDLDISASKTEKIKCLKE